GRRPQRRRHSAAARFGPTAGARPADTPWLPQRAALGRYRRRAAERPAPPAPHPGAAAAGVGPRLLQPGCPPHPSRAARPGPALRPPRAGRLAAPACRAAALSDRPERRNRPGRCPGRAGHLDALPPGRRGLAAGGARGDRVDRLPRLAAAAGGGVAGNFGTACPPPLEVSVMEGEEGQRRPGGIPRPPRRPPCLTTPGWRSCSSAGSKEARCPLASCVSTVLSW